MQQQQQQVLNVQDGLAVNWGQQAQPLAGLCGTQGWISFRAWHGSPASLQLPCE